MKASKISLVAALVAGVMLAYSPALRAQDANAGQDAKKHAGRPGGAGMKEHLNKMAEDLKLTTDQKTKVEAAMKEQGEKMRGLRDLPQDQRREKGKALREEMTKKMKEILKPEQFEKWEKMRPQGRPGGKKRGGDTNLQ